MFIRDLFENPLPDPNRFAKDQGRIEEFQNQDDESIAKKTDTRKTRLTLKHINRLRILRDSKMVEYHASLEKVKTQYGSSSEDGDMGGDLEF